LGCHASNNGTVAAKVCYDLIDDYLGYNDWYLPAKSQWETMYNYLNDVIDYDFSWSGYEDNDYWSSTEYLESSGYFFNMYTFYSDIYYKTNVTSILRVRCVRDP
jgi:hypothetical protein